MHLPRAGKILMEKSFDIAMEKIEDKFTEIEEEIANLYESFNKNLSLIKKLYDKVAYLYDYLSQQNVNLKKK